jgi:beta-N-acetylhexosaminidase
VFLRYSLSYFDCNWRMDSLAYYDRIIACFENKYFAPVGIPFLKGVEAESVWTFNMLPKEQMIAISYSNPYYLNYYFQHIPVLINVYSSDKYIQEAVVRTLTGEIQFRGSSPVKLEHDILR